MNEPIPFNGLVRQYASLKAAIHYETDIVLSSGWVIGGQKTEQLQIEIAKRCDRKFALAVNSCTAAMDILLRTHQPPCITDITLPAFSYVASLNVALANGYSGWQLDFNDVDKFTGMMELDENLASCHLDFGPVIFANMFGNVGDWDLIHELYPTSFLIEDAAQSFGASYKGRPSGSLGDVSVLSFDPTKNLPSFSGGGMILMDDEHLYSRLSAFTSNSFYSYPGEGGTNSQMSEVDCAVLLLNLKYFDKWQEIRTGIANYYTDNLHENVGKPRTDVFVVPSWSKYVINVEGYDRNKLRSKLFENNIETKIHYDQPLTLADSPNAQYLCKNLLSLPIHPWLSDVEVERVVTTFNSVLPHCTSFGNS